MSIPFPSSSMPRITANSSSLSLLHTASIDVCNGVYADSMSSSQDALQRFYEPNAGVYENPVLTASSRSVIEDIFQLSHQFHQVDVHTPRHALAMLYTLFRLEPPRILGSNMSDDSLFRALQVWHELEDVCESDSFDGHRKSMIEHTLNILILPGIHIDRGRAPYGSSESLLSLSTSQQQHPISPALRIPGTSATVSSPLHLQLHIITRLSFNEQGRITHHRDFWDIKDVLGLIPGVSVAQWIGTRLAATGLRYLLRSHSNVGEVARRAKHQLGGRGVVNSAFTSPAESDVDTEAAIGS